MLPTLVKDAELVAANSGIWTAAVLSKIALAAFAGILGTAFGAGPAFGINAVSFVLSAVLLVGLQMPAVRPGIAPRTGTPPLGISRERRCLVGCWPGIRWALSVAPTAAPRAAPRRLMSS